ncbi:MAG: DUF1080 domain-containing protein [Bacteroidales bacterium]|nr:DUF1080 domain-containing protein [Bacteroidales bacterium]
MKKTFSLIIAAVLFLGSAAYAQDARQRTVPTIVQDVLAQMPLQNEEDFAREVKDLADNAPATVTYMAAMLAPASQQSNALYEYAISALVNYATRPENAACVPAVKQGLIDGISVTTDIYNLQFLVSQMRLLRTEIIIVCDAYSEKLTDKYEALASSDKSQERCQSLWLAGIINGADAAPVYEAALKDPDRAYRVTALKAAGEYVGEGFAKTAIAAYNKLTDEARADVINYLGENLIAAGEKTVLGAVKAPGELGSAAIKAASLLGGDKAADALIALLGTSRSEEALAALKCFNGDIAPKVTAALGRAKGDKLGDLLTLAGTRRIEGAAPVVFATIASGSALKEAALGALEGVVREKDFSAVSALLDKAAEADVPQYCNALMATIKTLDGSQKYEKVSAAIASASHPERFYTALASSNTNEALKDLEALCDKSDAAALKAILLVDNGSAAHSVHKYFARCDCYILRYVELTGKYISDVDQKCLKYSEALSQAKNPQTRNAILKAFRTAPTMKAFLEAGKCMEDPSLAYEAAHTARIVAANSLDDIDYATLGDVLGKAKEIYAKAGSADDGYAIDEINLILADAKPVGKITLSEEEAAQGFELLFDGTNLDSWTGDLNGYTPVNGTIYVTANYGAARNLYTKKEYRDFIFRFEFCFMREGVNNGVGVRTPMGVDAAFDGMCEVQILDHDAPMYAGLQDYQVHGSAYGIVPAKRIVHKPLGEWSTEEIIVKGDRVKVTVNGEVILDADLREACQGHAVAPDGGSVNPYMTDHRNHPGLFNEKGHVGFLGHGAGVKFRNVRILSLDK